MNPDHPLVPKHKCDLETARAAVAAGYPAVDPILPDLLEWLQDYNWPVSRVLEPFLKTVGLPLVPHLRAVLESDDDIWKHWVILCIIKGNPEVREVLRPELERIVANPTGNELAEEVFESAQEALGSG